MTPLRCRLFVVVINAFILLAYNLSYLHAPSHVLQPLHSGVLSLSVPLQFAVSVSLPIATTATLLPYHTMRCFVQQSDKYVTVEMSSAYFNVFNFILFDIVLASLLFYLTAEIAGLVNAASALQESGNRLHAYNPPLVGVGLCTTRRNVFRVLAGTRALAMLGVLATNFLIEGISCERVRNVVQDVVMPGKIDMNTPQVDIRRLALRRRGCQGRFQDLVYYGELRLGQRCELRRPLITTPIVYFGLKFVNRTIVLPKNGCRFYTDRRAYKHIHQYSCDGLGTIACLINSSTNASFPLTCEGVVLADDVRTPGKGKVAYLCSGDALFPNYFGLKRSTNIARCRMAENVNTTATSWVPLLHNKARTIRDSIDAYYGATQRKITVKVTDVNDRIQVSQVEKSWFYILGIKLFIISLLIAVDLWMRCRGGISPAANNELGLGSLLAQSAACSSWHGAHGMLDEEDEDDIHQRTQLLIQNEHGVLRARSVTVR